MVGAEFRKGGVRRLLRVEKETDSRENQDARKGRVSIEKKAQCGESARVGGTTAAGQKREEGKRLGQDRRDWRGSTTNHR